MGFCPLRTLQISNILLRTNKNTEQYRMLSMKFLFLEQQTWSSRSMRLTDNSIDSMVTKTSTSHGECWLLLQMDNIRVRKIISYISSLAFPNSDKFSKPASWMPHLEKFSLEFSSSSFEIPLNLPHTFYTRFLLFFGVLCLSELLLICFNLKVIWYITDRNE